MPLIELTEVQIAEIEWRLLDHLKCQEIDISNSSCVGSKWYSEQFKFLERDKAIIETILNKLKGINNA